MLNQEIGVLIYTYFFMGLYRRTNRTTTLRDIKFTLVNWYNELNLIKLNKIDKFIESIPFVKKESYDMEDYVHMDYMMKFEDIPDYYEEWM